MELLYYIYSGYGAMLSQILLLQIDSKLQSLLRRIAKICLPLLCVAAASQIQAAQNVALAWNPSNGPGLVGYRLHQGTSSGSYTQTLDVGNATTAALSNLQAGSTYYFTVTAYNSAGVESSPSN